MINCTENTWVNGTQKYRWAVNEEIQMLPIHSFSFSLFLPISPQINKHILGWRENMYKITLTIKNKTIRSSWIYCVKTWNHVFIHIKVVFLHATGPDCWSHKTLESWLKLSSQTLRQPAGTGVSDHRITWSLRLLSALGGERQRESMLLTGTPIALSNGFHKMLRGCFMSGTDFLTFSSPSHLSFNTHLKRHLFQELPLTHLTPPPQPELTTTAIPNSPQGLCWAVSRPSQHSLSPRAPPEPALL